MSRGFIRRTEKAAGHLDDCYQKQQGRSGQNLAIIEGIAEREKPLARTVHVAAPDRRQTVGGVAVSFLLRPCSFASLVVFGKRRGTVQTLLH